MEAPCNKCKESNKMNTKLIKISKPPEILIFSIQRILPYTNTKNNCYVNFPDILDITDFIDEDLGKNIILLIYLVNAYLIFIQL